MSRGTRRADRRTGKRFFDSGAGMTRFRFAMESDGCRVLARRSTRRHGGAREAASQDGGVPAVSMSLLAVLAVCLLPGLSAGCRAAPEGLRPPRIPAERATLDAASVTPEPGVELRRPADRADFDIGHYRLELDLSRPASGEFAAVATLRGDLAAGADRVDLDLRGQIEGLSTRETLEKFCFTQLFKENNRQLDWSGGAFTRLQGIYASF